jgi:predicted nucleotidyltransferase
MDHGLTAATVAKIHEVFCRHPEIEKAVLYGSRARGNFKPGSDIDLTLIGEKLDSKILGRLDSELDDLLLPYEFDLSIFSHLTHQELIKHIQRGGMVFYERPPVRCQP